MSKKLTSMLNNVAISDNIFMNFFLYTLRCCDFTHMLSHLCYFYNVVGIYLHIFFVFSFRMSFFAIIRFWTTLFRLPRYAKNDFDFKIIEWFFELFGIIKSEQFELKPLSCFGSSKIQHEQSSTVYDFWFSKPFQFWLNNTSKSNEHTHAHKIATEGVWMCICECSCVL